MARRFLYASVGLLCLVASYQGLTERAAAEWDASATPIMGGAFAAGGVWVAFTAGGEAWSVAPNVGWIRRQDFDLPVASSSVAFLDSNGELFVLITTAGDTWELADNGLGWFQIDTFPGGPIAVPAETWGKIKAKHR
jgi:hypothetical protein